MSTESGNVLIWNVRAEAVVFKTEQKNVQQLLLLDEDTKFVTVSKVLLRGGRGCGEGCGGGGSGNGGGGEWWMLRLMRVM